jgi:hypothetical protein
MAEPVFARPGLGLRMADYRDVHAQHSTAVVSVPGSMPGRQCRFRCRARTFRPQCRLAGRSPRSRPPSAYILDRCMRRHMPGLTRTARWPRACRKSDQRPPRHHQPTLA